MPGALNPADYKLASGELDRPLRFYSVPPPLDAAGGVLDPAAAAINPTFLWQIYGGNLPYQGVEIRDALTKLGETWATFVIRYAPSRIVKEGYRVIDVWSSDEFEVTGVMPIGNKRLRVQLTCRKIS